MLKQQIKVHRFGTYYEKPHFFILNKGNNSGKPLQKECPNCFVCLCNSENEKQHLFYLCYALWQGKVFQPLLIGSVISFIRIGDLVSLLNKAVQNSKEPIQKITEQFQLLDKHATNLNNQLKLISQLKIVLAQKLLNP